MCRDRDHLNPCVCRADRASAAAWVSAYHERPSPRPARLGEPHEFHLEPPRESHEASGSLFPPVSVPPRPRCHRRTRLRLWLRRRCASGRRRPRGQRREHDHPRGRRERWRCFDFDRCFVARRRLWFRRWQHACLRPGRHPMLRGQHLRWRRLLCVGDLHGRGRKLRRPRRGRVQGRRVWRLRRRRPALLHGEHRRGGLYGIFHCVQRGDVRSVRRARLALLRGRHRRRQRHVQRRERHLQKQPVFGVRRGQRSLLSRRSVQWWGVLLRRCLHR